MENYSKYTFLEVFCYNYSYFKLAVSVPLLKFAFLCRYVSLGINVKVLLGLRRDPSCIRRENC
jgi:hypothetical protein